MLGDFHNLTAIPAPCPGWLVINMQLTPLRQRPLTDDVETETHGALFNAGERPDFQPNAGYTFDTVLLCLLLNNLNRALTKDSSCIFAVPTTQQQRAAIELRRIWIAHRQR